MQRFLLGIDRFSGWSGKAVAWLILASTILISYDVVMRYLSKPICEKGAALLALCEPLRTIWFTYYYAYDMTYYLYAIFFMLGGAYALSRGQHLRGDVFYRLWPVRVQAGVDLVLFLFAFFPGILALVSVGAQWAEASWEIKERSFTTAAAPPIYPLKAIIPIAGVLMAIQGTAETIRAARALQTGVWPARLSDVEETETVLAHQEEL
ncbi:MAG: TRAP transporter small permease subunit [Chloroflexi bacterium]|nr:TRAP transporter small permease subunit [Chloroflexota bacterium]